MRKLLFKPVKKIPIMESLTQEFNVIESLKGFCEKYDIESYEISYGLDDIGIPGRPMKKQYNGDIQIKLTFRKKKQ